MSFTGSHRPAFAFGETQPAFAFDEMRLALVFDRTKPPFAFDKTERLKCYKAAATILTSLPGVMQGLAPEHHLG